jgi:hypothetical protein
MAIRTYERLKLGHRDDWEYWAEVYRRAEAVGSDGCSVVSEIYRDACVEHDVHYRTGRTIHGDSLTRREADAIFWERMVDLSPLRWFSPVAWLRWLGVRIGAGRAWRGEP